MKRGTRVKLIQAGFVSLFWLGIALFKVIYDYLFIQVSAKPDYQYDLSTDVFTSILVVALAGLLGATTMVFILKDIYKNFPLWVTLLINAFTITSVIIIVCFPASMFYFSYSRGLPLWNELVIENSWSFYLRPDFLIVLLVWTVVSMLTLVFLQVNDRYGHGKLLDLLMGRYYSPKQEERIFMFLDMKSSTTIAETLGDKKYFTLLNRLYVDLNEVIHESYGEIYQYVGDEIVITWKLKSGIKKGRCIDCFFTVDQILDRLSEEYFTSYGHRPEFKAALHCGKVTTGEVGTVKKDIIYTGDVLNTTSRILECCNGFDAKLIVSDELLKLIQTPTHYTVISLGEFKFRGKRKEVPISTVMNANLEGIKVRTAKGLIRIILALERDRLTITKETAARAFIRQCRRPKNA
ncbi:adenylate/guanylate cyclase domain-containing protein [Roseivirga sp. BDSF3-8]|uniref:adenylate/guanylate cyclase domain-containing protein n=1 Tax=Roseivirga sp. BDSF3-8 TaxID=3241598 RepID=UPI00353198AD